MSTRTSADEILKAAASVFYRRGYHAAKVSEIAREAGVAQGTFYLYFPSKEQAFVELIQRFGEEIRGALLEMDWTNVRTVEDLRMRSVDVCAKILQVCADSREVAHLFFNATASVSERSAAVVEEFMRSAEGILTEQLVEGTNRGYIRPLKAEVVARAIVGLYLSCIVRTIIAEGRSHGLWELAQDLVDFEFRGTAVHRPGAGK